MCGCLSHGPHWGPGPQPRYVPQPGTEPATLWLAGWQSIHWVTTTRAFTDLLKEQLLFTVFFLLLFFFCFIHFIFPFIKPQDSAVGSLASQSKLLTTMLSHTSSKAFSFFLYWHLWAQNWFLVQTRERGCAGVPGNKTQSLLLGPLHVSKFCSPAGKRNSQFGSSRHDGHVEVPASSTCRRHQMPGK